jgi:hypothetical protein
MELSYQTWKDGRSFVLATGEQKPLIISQMYKFPVRMLDQLYNLIDEEVDLVKIKEYFSENYSEYIWQCSNLQIPSDIMVAFRYYVKINGEFYQRSATLIGNKK